MEQSDLRAIITSFNQFLLVLASGELLWYRNFKSDPVHLSG